MDHRLQDTFARTMQRTYEKRSKSVFNADGGIGTSRKCCAIWRYGSLPWKGLNVTSTEAQNFGCFRFWRISVGSNIIVLFSPPPYATLSSISRTIDTTLSIRELE